MRRFTSYRPFISSRRLVPSLLIVLTALFLGWSPAQAAKAPIPNHQMSCFNFDFQSQPEIGQLWGYHPLYWKACHAGVTFDDQAANPPGPYGPSSIEVDILNYEEANLAVFPGGDPPGGWIGFWNHPHPSPDEEEQLLLGATLCMDRWQSPAYTFAEVEPGLTTEVVIRAVRYGALDPANVCCDWFNANELPNEVAAQCAADHDFDLQWVWYGWWDHGGNYFEVLEPGSTFLSRVDHFFPWYDYIVCDPPEALIPLYLELQDETSTRSTDAPNEADQLPCRAIE
ncbi:MAG: hypothetical protein AAF560_02690 [Acidobacteriota bacterium]